VAVGEPRKTERRTLFELFLLLLLLERGRIFKLCGSWCILQEAVSISRFFFYR
jgi:hypothetical protein